MPIQILMPALSPTMEEGTLGRWLVREGDAVRAGDVIAEIETDKATMEVEAVDEGVIGRILVAAGTSNVKVNTPIALLTLDDEAAAPRTETSLAAQAATPPVSAPAAKTTAPPANFTDAQSAQSGGARPAQLSDARPAQSNVARLVASPLARRLARERQVDLATVSGSGPAGRIVGRDVEMAAASQILPPQRPAAKPSVSLAEAQQLRRQTPANALAPSGRGAGSASDEKVLALYDPAGFEIVPHDGMRRVIAERLTLSKQTIPHFYLTIECRLDGLLKAREMLNRSSPQSGPRAYKLSINDFLIKAMALALQQVPAANVTWLDSGMARHKTSDIGVAVAVEGGLYTPLIRHAELKSLAEISNEMKELAGRAKQRRLAPHEYQGGTTSISNLGMYGITAFDAVINPPHATILAVGAGERRPVVVDDRIEIGTVMSCTLSCDHRAVDGAVGAELLAAFKAYVEDPVRMLV